MTVVHTSPYTPHPKHEQDEVHGVLYAPCPSSLNENSKDSTSTSTSNEWPRFDTSLRSFIFHRIAIAHQHKRASRAPHHHFLESPAYRTQQGTVTPLTVCSRRPTPYPHPHPLRYPKAFKHTRNDRRPLHAGKSMHCRVYETCGNQTATLRRETRDIKQPTNVQKRRAQAPK